MDRKHFIESRNFVTACADPGPPTCWMTDNSTALWCPGWVDQNTGCQAGADYCIHSTWNNTAYAPSVGAAAVCDASCSPSCSYPSEMHCSGKYADGCHYSYCLPNPNPSSTMVGTATVAMQTANGTCPTRCPLGCNLQFDNVCDMGVDNNGCWMGGYCVAKSMPNWSSQAETTKITECPGICSTPCKYPGEVYCPIPSTTGCYMGNTCKRKYTKCPPPLFLTHSLPDYVINVSPHLIF